MKPSGMWTPMGTNAPVPPSQVLIRGSFFVTVVQMQGEVLGALAA